MQEPSKRPRPGREAEVDEDGGYSRHPGVGCGRGTREEEGRSRASRGGFCRQSEERQRAEANAAEAGSRARRMSGREPQSQPRRVARRQRCVGNAGRNRFKFGRGCPRVAQTLPRVGQTRPDVVETTRPNHCSRDLVETTHSPGRPGEQMPATSWGVPGRNDYKCRVVKSCTHLALARQRPVAQATHVRQSASVGAIARWPSPRHGDEPPPLSWVWPWISSGDRGWQSRRPISRPAVRSIARPIVRWPRRPTDRPTEKPTERPIQRSFSSSAFVNHPTACRRSMYLWHPCLGPWPSQSPDRNLGIHQRLPDASLCFWRAAPHTLGVCPEGLLSAGSFEDPPEKPLLIDLLPVFRLAASFVRRPDLPTDQEDRSPRRPTVRDPPCLSGCPSGRHAIGAQGRPGVGAGCAAAGLLARGGSRVRVERVRWCAALAREVL